MLTGRLLHNVHLVYSIIILLSSLLCPSLCWSGASRDFDGVCCNRRVDATTNITAYPFTVTGWADCDAAGGVVTALVDTAVGNVQYGIFLCDDPTIRARNTTVFDNSDTTSLVGAGWRHWMGVFNSATSRTFYISCSQVATGTNSVTFNASTGTQGIGRFSDSSASDVINGRIAHIATFSSGFSVAECQNQTFLPEAFPSSGFWAMWDASTTTEQDLSGNNNDGTVQNAPEDPGGPPVTFGMMLPL